jgi:hypothetical protein
MTWLLLAACAARHEPAAAVPVAEAPVAEPVAEEEAPPPPRPVTVPPENAARFRELARHFPEHDPDPRHFAALEVLDALASAVDDLGVRYPGLDDEAALIRKMAGLVAGSEPTSLSHADWMRVALDAGVNAVAAVSLARPDLALLPLRVRWAREALDGLDPTRPLIEERGDLALTFSRLADAVAMAAELPASMAAAEGG